MNPTSHSKEEELLTLTEIVEWIKVSESTIYRWMLSWIEKKYTIKGEQKRKDLYDVIFALLLNKS